MNLNDIQILQFLETLNENYNLLHDFQALLLSILRALVNYSTLLILVLSILAYSSWQYFPINFFKFLNLLYATFT